jgi:hypothetical protein
MCAATALHMRMDRIIRRSARIRGCFMSTHPLRHDRRNDGAMCMCGSGRQWDTVQGARWSHLSLALRKMQPLRGGKTLSSQVSTRLGLRCLSIRWGTANTTPPTESLCCRTHDLQTALKARARFSWKTLRVRNSVIAGAFCL